MLNGREAVEGFSPEAAGQNLIDSQIFPQTALRVESLFSKITPLAQLVRNKWLQSTAAVLIGGASLLLAVDYDKNDAQAKEPNFPDPAPKKPLEIKGVMSSQTVRIVSNYEVQFFKTAGSEVVGVANLPQETTQHIFKEKEDPQTGEKRLQQIGTASYPLRITDAAISPDNPDTVFGVGLDMLSGKGKAILTSNEGQNWQLFDLNQVPLLGRGPLLKVEIVDPIQAFIAQGDPLASDYPNFFLNFNLNSKTFTDLQVCAGCTVGGIYGGLPADFLTLPDNTLFGYKSADPHLGYARQIFTSSAILSSEELRGSQIGYVQGDPKQYNDRQGLNNVLVFNNFARSPINPDKPSGIVYRDRYQRPANNFTFYDGVYYYPSTSYPPDETSTTTKFGTSIFSLVPDAATDDIFAGIAVAFAAAPSWVDSRAAYLETINNNVKLPTNGVWINPENERLVDIKGLGLSIKGENKLLQTAQAKYKWVYNPINQTIYPVFEEGRLMTLDITGGINPQRQWQGLNLYIYDSTYKLYLPLIMENRSN